MKIWIIKLDMKSKIILFTILALLSLHVYSQQKDCLTARVYEAVFKDIKLGERKVAAIEIGYIPDEYIIDLIKEMEIFNTKEIATFNEAFDETDYLSCTKFKKKVELLEDENLIKDNGDYYVSYFSKLVSLSETRKCVLSRNGVRSTKYEGGKAIGGEILYILEKENDSWIVKEKKAIVTY